MSDDNKPDAQEDEKAEAPPAAPAPVQTTAPIAAAALTNAGPLLQKRGGPLRQALLEKLPELGYRGANVAEIAQVAADSELKSLMDLEADALLEPLRSIAPRRGE
jgi:hypothetical protein